MIAPGFWRSRHLRRPALVLAMAAAASTMAFVGLACFLFCGHRMRGNACTFCRIVLCLERVFVALGNGRSIAAAGKIAHQRSRLLLIERHGQNLELTRIRSVRPGLADL